MPVELRGAGPGQPAGQQLLHARHVFEADKLIAVEVLTPGGNWSSYPPHKHDEDREGEAELEEIYYFEVADGRRPGGYQRVYSTGPDRQIDVCAEVRSGDVVLIPDGWHGPSMAAPGYDLYYLNVMAGPGAERAWLICDDPAHGWIRGTWAGPGGRPPAAPDHGTTRGDVVTPADGRPGLVRFLAAQYTERDGVGSGSIAGTLRHLRPRQRRRASARPAGGRRPGEMPYHLARNEQAMVHAAVGYARMRNRLQAQACTTSIGPGATNLVTGAALATINRLPVLLLPGDIFATRVADPVLQQLEQPYGYDVTVNDAFRPLSRYFDRVSRPEQLSRGAAGAMRVLTDPAETGAVTLALPQDVQAEAYDWPEEFFAERVWHVARPVPEPAALERAAAIIRGARRPLIVAGGGVHYSEATDALRALRRGHRHPGRRHPGRQGRAALGPPAGRRRRRLHRHAGRQRAGPRRRRGDRRRHPLPDFTTASRTAFQQPGRAVRQPQHRVLDAAKHAGAMLVADAREGLDALRGAPRRATAPAVHLGRDARGTQVVDEAFHRGHQPLPAQTEVLGALNEAWAPATSSCTPPGSLPGDLHKLWRARDPKQYHVEYGYSCMGYEIAGALGVKLAAPGPGGVGAGRRRHLPDDGRGDRHRGAGGHQAQPRARPEPRLRLDRRALRVASARTLRHQLPLPRPGHRHADRRAAAGRSGRQRREPGRAR